MKEKDLKALAHFMDSKFSTPVGKIGFDGIIGLVPVVGDLVTTLFSLYIIYGASALGAPPVVLSRMALNVAIDDFVGAIPIIGNIFDFFFKANDRNMKLLERYLQNPTAAKRSSTIVVVFLCIAILALIAGTLVLSYFVLRWIVGLFQQGSVQTYW